MRGRALALSLPRRIIADLMHFSADVPGIPLQRRLRLGALLAARGALPQPPSWSAIFVKAFALVAREMPELRRAHLKLPRARLYEWPDSAAAVAIERRFAGDTGVLFLIVKTPAALRLAEISRRIRRAAEEPVEKVRDFRRVIRVARLPQPVRRALWRLGLNLGRVRGNHFGTFGVTAVSALGGELLHPRSPHACLLTYGVIAEDGSAEVRLVFDHRVLDGALAARALARLEEVLNGPILAELSAPSP